MPEGTLRAVLKQAGIEPEEFIVPGKRKSKGSNEEGEVAILQA